MALIWEPNFPYFRVIFMFYTINLRITMIRTFVRIKKDFYIIYNFRIDISLLLCTDLKPAFTSIHLGV